MGASGVLGGHRTIDMTKWRIVSMDVGLVGAPAALCPGERVQLSIVAGLEHVERDKSRTAQTYEGDRPGLGARGKLGFETFTLRSGQGSFDDHGWFTPALDPFASVGGFTLEVVHEPDPTHAAQLNLRPRYDCVQEAGGAGAAGASGSGGAAGGKGRPGADSGSARAGGAGGAGAEGGSGGSGTAGAAGPSLSAWATVVRTPHHPHLVLIEFDGDVRGRVMFDSHDTFVLRASGGEGGPGGPGGEGGPGGDGGDGLRGGAGGAGGSGGSGGAGGAGGPGGWLTLHVDERFPELAGQIRLDVGGGPGGLGGAGGSGGSGGQGGQSSAEDAPAGVAGPHGSDGAHGANGADGRVGEVTSVRVDVSGRFAALPPGVEML